MARARTILVKLRQQVGEVAQGVLQQGVHQLMLCIEEVEEGGPVGGPAPASLQPVSSVSRVARGSGAGQLTSLIASAPASSPAGAGEGAGRASGGGAAKVAAAGRTPGGGLLAQAGSCAGHPIIQNMEELGQLVRRQGRAGRLCA